MKRMKTIYMVLLILGVFSIPINCLATDSTNVRQGQINAMKPVVGFDEKKDCFTTDEVRYTVTATNYISAYPACPANMTIKKIDLRTVRTFLEVDTYIKIVCCKNQIQWEKANKKSPA